MKNIGNVLIRVILVLSVFLAPACKKDKPTPQQPAAPPAQPNDSAAGRKVYVLNEGLFGTGKGMVSLYYPATGFLVEDHFGSQNNGAALGDVVLSMVRHNDEYFIVVNNSGKIVVTDLAFKKKGEIAGLASPRYILPIIGNIAYVSDYKSGSIAVVDLASRIIIKQVPLPGFTEKMILFDSNVYVTNVFRNYMYKIDPTAHQVTDSIEVGPGGGSIVADKNGKIWVLASGDYLSQTPGRLSRIDPAGWTVEASFQFDQAAYASELCLSPGNDTLYYVDNGIRRMGVADQALPSGAFISAGAMNIYALDIDAATGNLYVADAIDYQQRSTVLVYKTNGVLFSSVKAGVMATGFYFE